MIAIPQSSRKARPAPAWQRQFLAMLPSIHSCARHAFGHLDPERRADAVEEVLANAAVAFARLVALDKTDLAYPTVLARYGIAQVREGRRVGARLRIGEVLSPYAQRKKGFIVQRLDRWDHDTGQWLEAIVEDHRTPVPDQVASLCLAISRALAIPLQPGAGRFPVHERYSTHSIDLHQYN